MTATRTEGPIVVVQIPCFNEADSVPAVIASVPRSWECDGRAIERVVILVIDDGSEDGTGQAARAAGADEVLRLGVNAGLAEAFRRGLERALELGADVIVNLDGDHQYRGEDVPRLVEPLLRGQADFALGTRAVASLPHFGLLKRRMQVWGSALVRLCSGLRVSDATTGFRAFTRGAALRINVHSAFTYTLETLIQAGVARLVLAEVPVEVNPPRRPSRLARSTFDYMVQSLKTAPRMVLLYRPLLCLTILGLLTAAPGLVLGLRYLRFHFAGVGGHVQSLILAAVLILSGFGLIVLGLVGDVIAGNRRLLEESLRRLRALEYRRGSEGGA